ncbi:MAG: cupin domain-containing protein [Alphaproteobacteria bacterium]|nr:cupin domain-containing protein [Alphaproteobacteria bacterium]
MERPIVNLADLEYRTIGRSPTPADPDPRYEARLGAVGARIGARLLGYNVTVLPPGKSAFPRHSHHVNEEMFLVLSGSGAVRIGDASHAIREGDVIACPPGGPETAHQIVNTSASDELRFLAVSTRISPELAEYPDSGKFGIYADLPTGPGGASERMRFVSRREAGLDYWEGE